VKNFLRGCAAVVFSCGAALAADQPAPAHNWSGIYGGVHAGYGWGENKIEDALGIGSKYEPAGWFGGVQIGYNNHFAPHWLVGGEVDLSAGDVRDKIEMLAGLVQQDRFDFFGTARTRFGYVQDRWLVYGTAGAIWLRDKYTLNTSAPGLSIGASLYHVGWVFGGGIEYAVDDRWSWKLEYLYAPLGRSHDSYSIVGGSWDPNLSIVRAGLNYRFAGGGGAPAGSMPMKAAAPRPDWSGSYIGVHGGYGWGRLQETAPLLSPSGITASYAPDGGYGGFQSGYNWMFAPNALFGVEVDSSFGSLRGDGRFDLSASPVPPGPETTHAKIDALGTARLRLGYLVTPDTLVYATGGAAYAREKMSFQAINTKVDHFGWTFGGGIEWKFAPEWSLKAEYLYADLGSFQDSITLFNVTQKRESDLTLNTVRVGLNYSGPVIERLFGAR